MEQMIIVRAFQGLAFAGQNVVDFGRALVVVRAGIAIDVHDMQRRDLIWIVSKRAP